MSKAKKHPVLRIILFALLFIIVGAVGYVIWLSHHYKQTVREQLPAMITHASDSIYHISFSDIDIDLYNHKITITNLRLWPDTNQANALRLRHHYAPNTTSTVFIPKLEAFGITWSDLASKRSLDCKNVVIHHIKWFIETIKHSEDTHLITSDEPPPIISRITVAQMNFVDPDLSYHYVGAKYRYRCFLKGGTAILNKCAFDYDIKMDTSVFLYAQNGTIKPESFTFHQDGHIHSVKHANIDFTSSQESITLKNVKIDRLADFEEKTKSELMIYNFNFPSVEFVHFNWKTLMNIDLLAASKVIATEPYIDVRFIRDNAPGDRNKVGHYPHQLIHEAIKINVRALHIKNARIKYTEPVTKTNTEGTIGFDHINGSFTNITNLDSIIAHQSSCIVKLKGKYNNKSTVSTTFDLSLSDRRGRFTVDGYVTDLDGDDISKQVAAFTFVKVTSFHLDTMKMHVEGDESYGKGNFTMLYNDLKISLFKFKSDDRKTKKGPMSFLANTLVLYPSNPMPHKGVRTASTSFARDPNNGFIHLIWTNMYRGAKKTAVRDERIIDATDGKETGADVKPRKEGLFKKIFKKKK